MARKTFFFPILLLWIALPIASSWGLTISSGPFSPLSNDKNYDAKMAALGKTLFFDNRLSKDNQLSCNSCHIQQLNGVDGRPKAIGPDNMIGKYNTPSLYNSALLYRLFWDGRERNNINRAISTHIEEPTIMAGKWPDILAVLSNDSNLSKTFSKTFETGLTQTNIVNALVNYVTSLNYSPSRFDQYLWGDKNALSSEEKIGLKNFMDLGCHFCHQGKLLGGNLIMTLGLTYPYPDNPTRKKYRVATLRNVTQTAPYFHDGSVSTLEEAIRIMAKYQLGVDVKDNEIRSIITFLRALESNLNEGAKNAP